MTRKRNRHIQVGCSDAEFAAIHALAKANRRTLSDLVWESIFARQRRPTDEIIHLLALIATRLRALERSETATPDLGAILSEIGSAISRLARLRP
jgi:hypothetical protein